MTEFYITFDCVNTWKFTIKIINNLNVYCLKAFSRSKEHDNQFIFQGKAGHAFTDGEFLGRLVCVPCWIQNIQLTTLHELTEPWSLNLTGAKLLVATFFAISKAEKILRLKVNAPVMLLQNIDCGKGLVNGRLGTVVQLDQDKINVHFQGIGTMNIKSSFSGKNPIYQDVQVQKNTSLYALLHLLSLSEDARACGHSLLHKWEG